jgi:hypothetical protein
MAKATSIVILTVAAMLAGLSFFTVLWAAPRGRLETLVAEGAPASPPSVLPGLAGTASCSGRACHGGLEPTAAPGRTILRDEYTKWLGQDKHAQAYEVLFDERSVRIAKNLGIPHAHLDLRCLACHTNPQIAGLAATVSVREERTFGVGCESCHGSAEKWLGPHTAQDWTPQKRQPYGMIPVSDPSALAQRCAGCHVGAPPGPDALVTRDVNHDLVAAGHPRLNFELTAFLANMPPHWNTTKPKRAAETQIWALGQTVCAQAALDLLAHRSKTAPWPEFAEYNCFACHHDLRQPSWRQEMGYGQRLPGALPWSDWYVAMPRLLSPEGSMVRQRLEDLGKEMEKPYPSPDAVSRQAKQLAQDMGDIQDRLKTRFGPKEMRAVLWPSSAENPKTARRSWDAAEQVYLALWALTQDGGNPGLVEMLRTLDRERRGLQHGFDSPIRFRPDRFFPALDKTLERLPNQ